MYANTVLPMFPVQYTVDNIDSNQLILILTSYKSQLSKLCIITYDYIYIYIYLPIYIYIYLELLRCKISVFVCMCVCAK